MDDVYDGVFEKLTIHDILKKEEKLVYTDELSGFEKISFETQKTWNHVLNWFIKNL